MILTVRCMQTTALQRALGKFNIAEVARTGKICLKRGEALLDMGGWGDGQLKQRREQQQGRVQQGKTGQSRAGDGSASGRDNGSSNGAAGGGAEGVAGSSERGVDEGQDVYVSGGADKAGWSSSACFQAHLHTAQAQGSLF